MTALREVAPRGVENALSLPVWAREGGAFDARLPWRVDGQDFSLDIRVKTDAGVGGDIPHLRDRAVPTGAPIPVFLSTFLPVSTRARLEEAGWSYWDTTGNMLLTSRDPFMNVRRTGARRDPSPTSEPRPLATLKGRATSEVVVRLLRDGGATTVRDLARGTKVGLGTVSRVVALLREENFLETTGGGPIVLADRIAVAQRWAEDYRFTKTFGAKRYYSRLGDETAVDRIKSSGVGYAFTGLRAASAWFAARQQVSPLPASDVWLYTDDLWSLVRVADLAPDPRRGSIWVAEADFFSVGEEGNSEIAAEHQVRPWRAVGDLLSTPGRHAAVGEDLCPLARRDEGRLAMRSDSPAHEYVIARKVLLDVLETLEPHLNAFVLVGAQAVYVHAPAGVAQPPYTTDSDLAIDPELLATTPDIGAALEASGFLRGLNPGAWVSHEGVGVDLMVAAGSQASSTRRSAPLAGHPNNTARSTRGLEVALRDHSPQVLHPFDPSDRRSVTIQVAGPAALVVSKLAKLNERLAGGR